MMDKEVCRKMTAMSLDQELGKISFYYMKIYDEYYSENSTRDSAFLKDLVDSIKGISAVLEVYVEHNGIHPSYAIEKLNYSLSIINSVKRYYENKLEERTSVEED